MADLSASILADIQRAEPDKEKAKILLAGLQSADPAPGQIDRMLDDLKEFQELGKEVITQTLRQHKWQVDDVLVPLFTMLETKRTQDAASKRKLEAEQRAEKARGFAFKSLQELFTHISKDQIKKLLNDHEGDVDACIEEILRLQKLDQDRKDQQEKEKEIQRQREEHISTLAYKFNKAKPEVAAVLEAHNWKLEATVAVLLKEAQEVTFIKLCKQFKDRDPLQIRTALEMTDYDEFSARRRIDDIIAKEERLRMAEKEKEEARRLAEEAAKQLKLLKEKEAQRNAEAAEAEKKEILRLADEQQKAEEAQQRKAKEQVKLTELLKETAVTVTQEEQDRNHLARTQRMMPDIDFQKETNAYVRNALEDVIRRHDSPQHDEPSAAAASGPVVTSPVANSPDNTAISNPVSIVTLTTSANAVDFGESITVTWALPSLPASSADADRPGGPNDWVGLFVDNANNNAYSYYEWTSKHANGSATFVAPSIPGTYVFRYFTNRSYNVVGSSKPISVGPTYQLTPTVGEGNKVSVNIQQNFGKPYPNSWIGLYDSSKPNTAYVTYENVGEKKEVHFTVPKAGIWEFRLFPLYRTYLHVASCKVDVNGETKISLTVEGQEVVLTYNVSTLDPKNDNIWFGIYYVDETNPRRWRRGQKIADVPVGVRRMKVLQHAGTYEARLFAHGNMSAVICKSNTITVPGPM